LETARFISLCFPLELEGLRAQGTKQIGMDDKPTWSTTTWHAKDATTTSRRWVTTKPGDYST